MTRVYFTANKVTDKDQQKAVLLSVSGTQTYKLIHNLLMPQTPDAVDYNDVVKRVQEHVRPSLLLFYNGLDLTVVTGRKVIL